MLQRLTQFILLGGALLVVLLLAASVAEPQAAVNGSESSAPLPAGYSTTVTGRIHDLDYLVGSWTTHQRRLKTRGAGKTDWEEAPANHHCATGYLDGMAVAEESRFPDDKPAGLFLYLFSAGKRQWSLYWVNSKTGEMDPGIVGGFDGSRGEFYGEDVDNGRPIKVRTTWTVLDHDHARWEQAFSYDNRTWETNWISEMTRTDPSKICEGDHPKH
jgi:hypothetical protein